MSRPEHPGENQVRMITECVQLQNTLLDYTGHVCRGLPRAEAKRLVQEINDLRQVLGWELLDMKGRWRR